VQRGISTEIEEQDTIMNEGVEDASVLMDFTAAFKNTGSDKNAPVAVKPWLRRKTKTTTSSNANQHNNSQDNVNAVNSSSKQRAPTPGSARSNRSSTVPPASILGDFDDMTANNLSFTGSVDGENGKENQDMSFTDMLNTSSSSIMSAGSLPPKAPRTGSALPPIASMSPMSAADASDAGISGLNARLDALGFPQMRVDQPETIISAVHAILEELRQSVDITRSYESTSHSAQMDCKRLQNEKEALKLQVLCLKQDLAALENRAKIAADQHAKEKQRNDAWVKELQVNIAKMEGQQKGWQAALNRKETEYERMQKRMQMLQTQRDRSVKRALEMDVPPTKGGVVPQLGERSSTAATIAAEAAPAMADDPEAAAQSLAVLEEAAETSRGRRVAYLVAENQKLRASLHTMQNLILTKLQALATTSSMSSSAARGSSNNESASGGENSSANQGLEIDTLRLADTVFDLPAEQLERRLAEVQGQTLAYLDDQEARANGESDQDHIPSEDELKERLDQAKILIQDLDACLRAVLLFQGPVAENPFDAALSNSGNSALDASMAAGNASSSSRIRTVPVDDDVDRLRAKQFFDQEQADLDRARERLEQDRAMLQEEARRIDEERAMLDRRIFAQKSGITPSPDVRRSMNTPSMLDRLATPEPRPPSSARKALQFADLGVAPTPATRKLLDEIL